MASPTSLAATKLPPTGRRSSNGANLNPRRGIGCRRRTLTGGLASSRLWLSKGIQRLRRGLERVTPPVAGTRLGHRTCSFSTLQR